MLFTLIGNEFRKIFKRSKTYVVSILFIAFAALLFIGSSNQEKRLEKQKNPEVKLAQMKDNLAQLDENIKSTTDDVIKMGLTTQKTVVQGDIDKLNKRIAEGTTDTLWRDDLKERIDGLQSTIDNKDVPVREKLEAKQELAQAQYYLAHNISNDGNSVNSVNYMYLVFQALATVFLAVGISIFMSDVVSGEVTPTTLKFLLIQPISRGKVLFSKFVAIVLSSLGLILGIELVATLLVGVFKGKGATDLPYMVSTKFQVDTSTLVGGVHPLKIVEGTSEFISALQFDIRAFLLQGLFIIACASFVFLISTLAKSSMISMAISIAVTVIAQALTQIVPQLRGIANLLFVSYSDPTSWLTGNLAVQYNSANMGIEFGIGVLVVTTVVCYVISHLVFTKRDILV